MANQIRLYTESLTPTSPSVEFLEFDGKTIVPLNFSVADVRDITKRKGSFSKSITIPGTKNNNRVLNNYFDVNIQAGTFDINKLQRCSVIQDDIPVLDNAIMQLVSVNKVQTNNSYESDVTYTLLIKDTTSDFFSNINNKTLDQLDFNWMSHIYNATNVIASFDNTVADGYKYVMPYNAASGNNDAQYSLAEFTPAIYAKQYWDQIFSGSGFTYNWPGLTGSAVQFDKLLIPYNGDTPTASREDSQFYGFSAVSNVAATVQNQFSTRRIIQSPKMIASGALVEVTDPNNLYNPVTGRYTMPVIPGTNNTVAFSYNIDFFITVKNTSGSPRWLRRDNTTTANQQPLRVVPNFYLYGTNRFSQNELTTVNAYGGNINGNQQIFLNNLYNIAGSTTTNLITSSASGTIPLSAIPAGSTIEIATLLDFFVGSQQSNNTSPTGYHWSSSSTVDTPVNDVFFELVVKSASISAVMQIEGEVGYNVPIYMNKFIPQNIKQNEFVKSILQMYNLYVEVDKDIPTQLNIYQRDEYYDSGKEEDWTKKLVKNKAQDLKFLPEITNKKLLLTYKEDKDWANVNYKSNTNEIYGQAEFVFDNEYVKDTTKVELLFSPTPTANTSFGAVCPIWNGQAPKTNIRILYDGGPNPCGPYAIWNYSIAPGATGFTGATASSVALVNNISTYPFVGHWDKPSNPTFDLQFLPSDYYFRSDAWGVNTNNNLFNLHWRRTANQLNTGKLLSAYFDLKSTDIQKMRLNDKIRIDNSWWNINKIQDYDANSEAPTKVELISVDDLLSPPFISTDSVGVDRSSNLWPDIRSLSYEQSKIRNTIYSEGDVMVSGVNNIVSPYSLTTNVIGDNNSVGGDSIIRGNNNISSESSIIIGDNNTIPEGAQGVMVVGSGITVGSTGGILYASNIEIPNGGTINGVPVASVISGDEFWAAGTVAQSIKQKDTLATATGIRAFSVGQGIGINGSIASGQDSIAFAGGNASGLRSFAHGIAAGAAGQDSVAFSSGAATALGSFSHAGNASGSLASSFSGGSAEASQSHAVGDGALAQTYSETVVGINASSITGNPGAYSASDPAFRVGNGTSNVTRSDAFRVYKNGASYLKPITTASVTSPIAGMMLYDSTSNYIKVYDGTAWVSPNGAPAYKVYRALVNGTTITIFENTLGTLTWSAPTSAIASSQNVSSSALFTTNKTFISATCRYGPTTDNRIQTYVINNSSSLDFRQYGGGSSHAPMMVEIIVYP